MATIVINADDFGLSDGVCQSILELFDVGGITSTSIMTAALEAQPRMRRWGVRNLQGKAGVHLQLTSGRPLSGPAEVPSLVDPNTGGFADPRKSERGPDPLEVETEWRRQIEAAMDLLGGLPTHLDSHHGMHRRPGLFEIYTKLASELNLPVRGGSGDIGKRLRSMGMRGSIAIVREWSGRSLGAPELKREIETVVAEHPDEAIIEVVVHPGHYDEYLSSVSSLSSAREVEHAALMELAQEKWLELAGHSPRPFSAF